METSKSLAIISIFVITFVVITYTPFRVINAQSQNPLVLTKLVFSGFKGDYDRLGKGYNVTIGNGNYDYFSYTSRYGAVSFWLRPSNSDADTWYSLMVSSPSTGYYCFFNIKGQGDYTPMFKAANGTLYWKLFTCS